MKKDDQKTFFITPCQLQNLKHGKVSFTLYRKKGDRSSQKSKIFSSHAQRFNV